MLSSFVTPAPRPLSSLGALHTCEGKMPSRHYKSLRLFDLHQKALELRSVRIGIDHRRSQLVRQRLRRLAVIFRNPTKSPMNREADLKHFLPVDLHRTNPPCDHGLCDVLTARAGHPYFLPAADAHP